jgi:hypothetical protein
MAIMTNITLSINEKTYRKMKKYSEIKWSEFVRKAIEARVAELERLDADSNREGVLTMLASESVLRRDWENDADQRWNNV